MRYLVNQPPQTIAETEELRAAVAEARRQGKRIGLVPTMGALHAGHLSLVEACADACDVTVVSVFVNPTQFGPYEDFERYPRDLDADIEALQPYGVGVVYVPRVEDMYPAGYATSVEVAGVTDRFEGAFRPGHFRGVATVVLKLFNLVLPDVAYFGQKDYQQSLVVRRMVADLNVPVAIRVAPTVRDADGLALSSRNAYLSPGERRQALSLSAGLRLAERIASGGPCDAATVRDAVRQSMAAHADVKIEYVALVDPQSLADVERVEGPTLVAVAARVGGTRLIDNMIVGPEK